MSKGIILYQSKYGATKKYVDWLMEETGYDCVEVKNAKVSQVQNYDVIVFGGGVYASGKMTFGDRTLCKMLQKAVAKQNPEDYEPWQKALICAVGQKCDWTDKKYLEPILKFIEEK